MNIAYPQVSVIPSSDNILDKLSEKIEALEKKIKTFVRGKSNRNSNNQRRRSKSRNNQSVRL